MAAFLVGNLKAFRVCQLHLIVEAAFEAAGCAAKLGKLVPVLVVLAAVLQLVVPVALEKLVGVLVELDFVGFDFVEAPVGLVELDLGLVEAVALEIVGLELGLGVAGLVVVVEPVELGLEDVGCYSWLEWVDDPGVNLGDVMIFVALVGG